MIQLNLSKGKTLLKYELTFMCFSKTVLLIFSYSEDLNQN